MTSAPDNLPPLTRADARVMLVLATLTLVLGLGATRFGVTGVFHDDGLLVITARALAEGDGYRLVNLPDAPFQTKYPPLYPALLGLLWAVWPSFPDNLVLLQGVTLVGAAAGVALSWGWLVQQRYASREVATVGCLLAAVSPTLLYYAGLLLTEAMFTPLLVLALWRLDVELKRERSGVGRQVALGALIALPALCRAIGLVVPVAVGLGLVAWVHWRRLPATAFGVALMYAPWVAWAAAVPHLEHPPAYLGYYVDYGGWLQTAAGFDPIICAWNGLAGLLLVGWLGMEGLAPFLPRHLGLVPMAVLMSIGLVPTWWAWSHRGRRNALPWALAGYLAIVLIWPWPPERFLVPVLPLLLVGVVWGAARVLERAPAAATVLASVLFAMALAQSAVTGARSRAWGYPVHPRVSSSNLGKWTSYQAMFDWISTETDPDALIASGLDPMVYLYTGRAAYRPFVGRPMDLYYGAGGPPVGTAAQLGHALVDGGATHMTQMAMPLFPEGRYVADLVDVLEAQGTLRPVYVDPSDSRFAVYEVIRPSGTQPPAAPPPGE